MTDWPGSSDYNEAIQNLTTSMGDEELRAGRAEQNAFGLPMPYAGAFADVYRIDCPATGNSWAVKCFTREVTDLRDRYRAISEHLKQARLSFMTPFHYLEQGIRIAGHWYPIVKMRWVEGEGLNQFVGRYFDQPETLRQLAILWIMLAERLEAADLAHADLQHGNVLLVPVRETNQLRLKLIDYDGMYVPALAGGGSSERGHPAFQHPQRLREGTYSPAVDRFSHLTIYTALECLVADPSLWQRYDNGQNLLFRESDFGRPGESELFRRLWETCAAPARDLVARLIAATQAPLEETPRLGDIIRNGVVLPRSDDDERRAAEVMGRSTAKTSAAEPARSSPVAVEPIAAAPKPPVPQPRLIRAFREHRAYVAAVAFAPNGRNALTGSHDTTALLRDAANGRKLCSFLGHEEAVASVAFSGNGRYVVTASHDRTAALWDAATGKKAVGFVGHRGALTSVAFCGDGRSIVTGSQDQTAALWDAATGQCTQRFAGHASAVTSVAVRHDGRFVLTGSRDRTAVLWDAYTGHRLRAFGGEAVVTSVAFNTQGDLVLIGSTDGTASVWDAATGDLLGVLRGHGSAVAAVAFTVDGLRIVTASNDKTAAVWDAETYERLQVLVGHTDYVTSAAFSPDGRYVLTGSEDKTALLWDTGYGARALRVVGD